jgi:hypothetical protein
MTRARNLGSVGGISYLSAIGNKIGVGITIPTSTFHVQGDVSIASTVGIGTKIDIVPYDSLSNGTLSFEGSAGQLFSITNNLTSGSIFSVNDVSGIPSIDVDANGTVEIAPFGGNLGVGTTNPTSKIHIIGDALLTGIITCTGATVNGNVTCVDLNSTSDINLKENIQTIDNALTLVQDIRGVKFEWKENHKPSIGVIAQEVEKILPELVTTAETKTVNYNGLIGLLIESVKELKNENDLLKAEISEIKHSLSQMGS